MKFNRITVNPMQMGGVPCLRGIRIPVATVIDMVADGMTPDEILGAYPDLEADDIEESLRFAADAVRERQLPIVDATLNLPCLVSIILAHRAKNHFVRGYNIFLFHLINDAIKVPDMGMTWE